MINRLFEFFSALNIFECEDDIYDIIADMQPFLEKNDKVGSVDTAIKWFTDIYDGMDKDGNSIDIFEMEKLLWNIVSSVLEDKIPSTHKYKKIILIEWEDKESADLEEVNLEIDKKLSNALKKENVKFCDASEETIPYWDYFKDRTIKKQYID